MSLYDRLVPAEALRFDRTHPMTAGWSFAYDNAGAFYLERGRYDVQATVTLTYATGGFIPKGDPHPLTQADFPLIRFTDEPIDIAAVIAAGEGVDKTRRSISTTPPRRSWLPWRKRR